MTDVIVVGGGPVGLMLACELRLGSSEPPSVLVLEKEPEPSPHSRAFRLQPRTLELLDQRGLLDRFRAGSKEWPKAHFAGIQPLLRLDRLDSDQAYSLLIPQVRTERLLRERALELGVELRSGHRVTALSQDPDGVSVEVSGPDGDYRAAARYLVGCDGGRSAVRRLAGIGFPGTGGSVTALLGDVVLDDPSQLPAGVPGTSRTADGLLMAVALEEGVTRVLTTEFTGPGTRSDAPVTLEELRDSIRRVLGRDVEIRDPRWLSRFSDATRLAERYRLGRVLLAGDAAHVHFPIGAQGLNLGLQEAVNLGWKLAAELRGQAAEGLLDSYGEERRPVAQRVLLETRAQLALMNPDERTDPLRELFGELLALDAVNLHLSALVSGTGARYGGDQDRPWVGAPAPRLELKTDDGVVRAADLLHDARGLLLVLDGADQAEPTIRQAAPWADRVDTVAGYGPENLGLSALLLRPDGHVAWAQPQGAPPVGLAEALATWFGDRPAATRSTP